jgi:hypothetical protein
MAAREEDKAMAGLLRRSLAQDAGTGSGGDCPEPEILAAYFDGALDAQETARYDLHFSRCSVCREQLAAMSRAGGADDAEEKTAGAWNWLNGQRWMMPAAAALVALVVISGIALRMRKPLTSPNQVAMSRPSAAPEAMPPPDASLVRPADTEEYMIRPAAPSQPGASGGSGATDEVMNCRQAEPRRRNLRRNQTRCHTRWPSEIVRARREERCARETRARPARQRPQPTRP